MPIPPDIDPFRALALCFGLTLPSDKKRDREAALERLYAFLEITPNQRTEFSKTASPILRDLVKLTTHKGEGWLELPERVARMIEKIAALNPLLKSAFTPQVEVKLNTLLDNPRIPLRTFNTLFGVLLARETRTTEDMAAAPRGFCHLLLERHPAAFERALQAYTTLFHAAPSDGATDPPDRGPLQQISRVFARLERAGNYGKRPREAIEAALHAWAGAFESIIPRALVFIWLVSQPLDKPPERLIPPQGAAGRGRGAGRHEFKKGQIFKDARDWCDAQGIEFPFYSKLDKLRHSQAHEDYSLSAKSVELRGHDGVLDTMSVRALISRVHQDVRFAFAFDQGLIDAVTQRREHSSEIEAAWKTATDLIPEIAQAVKPAAPRRGRQIRAKAKTKTKAAAKAKAKSTTKVAAKQKATSTTKSKPAAMAKAKAAATAKASRTVKSKAKSSAKKKVVSRRS